MPAIELVLCSPISAPVSSPIVLHRHQASKTQPTNFPQWLSLRLPRRPSGARSALGTTSSRCACGMGACCSSSRQCASWRRSVAADACAADGCEAYDETQLDYAGTLSNALRKMPIVADRVAVGLTDGLCVVDRGLPALQTKRQASFPLAR